MHIAVYATARCLHLSVTSRHSIETTERITQSTLHCSMRTVVFRCQILGENPVGHPIEDARYTSVVKNRIFKKNTRKISRYVRERDIVTIDKKLGYRRGTARRAMLVISCHVPRGVGVKGFKQKKWPSRAYDFLLVFRCYYLSILHHFRDIITYFPNF